MPPPQGVRIVTGEKMETVTSTGVRVVYANAEHKDYPADTIVLAMGMTARKDKVDELRTLLPQTEVAVIGDCYQPRNLFAAIHDGFNTVVEV